ncbi:hypothetical protein ACHAXS_007892 [Conticribra weissflogii]
MKAVIAGAGACFADAEIAQAAIDLTELPTYEICVLYIGTASYDINLYKERQTNQFHKMGCHVKSLNIANSSLTFEDMKRLVEGATIILVSGGNTLFAMERWRLLGLDLLIKIAVLRGVVMAGGSAGAICWFDGGHSDSMDPDTYRIPMLAKYGSKNGVPPNRSRFYGAPVDDHNSVDEREWDYIRVSGLGIFPGLICPHYDRIQSNGVPRLVDFDHMMKRHSSELGIGIDHNAALLISGSDFRVLSIAGQSGSVPASLGDTFFEEGSGIPGVWIKYVDVDGRVTSQVVPSRGKVEELMQRIQDPAFITLDARAGIAKKENPGPDDGQLEPMEPKLFPEWVYDVNFCYSPGSP